jgi:pilus assembly protein Flp/PilA
MGGTLVNLYVKLVCLAHSEEGQDMVEYGLLVALLALVCVGSINGLAGAVKNAFSQISSSLGNA